MDVAKIRITAEGVTDDATNKLKKLDGQVESTGKSTKEFGSEFKKSAMILAGSVAAITTVAKAMDALYKAGAEGAQINQVSDSFERLEDTLGPNVDLLDELIAASSGTIDDMTAMSSTLTLVAGAGKELQSNLLSASPQLMEIAKAANKLNPTLGDTAFLYNSIATGVKRASPLILDNLGIMIKVGDANEAYAKTLGKTVEELTAEEKQMALLNGTLEAGATLIEQAGGAAGGAVDPYNRLGTAVKNATDELKQNIDEGIRPTISALADLVDAFSDNGSGYRKSSDSGVTGNETLLESFTGLIGVITKTREAANLYSEAFQLGIIDETEMSSLAIKAFSHDLSWVPDLFDEVTRKQKENADGIMRSASANEQFAEQLARQTGNYISSVESETEAVEDNTEALEVQAQALESVIDKLYQGGDASDEFANRMNAAKYNIAVNRDELNKLGDTVDFLFDEGLITAEDIVSANAFIGVEAVMQELEGGIINTYEATKSLREDFGLTWGQAQEYIAGAVDPMQQFSDLLGGLDVDMLTDAGLSALQLAEDLGIPLATASTIVDKLNEINGTSVSATVNIHTKYSSSGNTGLGINQLPSGYTDYTKNEAVGGSGIVSKPTMFLAGEAGVPEKFSFEPLGNSGGGSSLDTDRIINELRRLAVDIGTETANALIVAEGA